MELLSNMGLLLYNVIGPLTLGLISELTLKMVLGVNLIGRRIFLLQKLHEDRKLSREEIDAEVMSF
jgi:hypothetical protein